MRPVALVRPIIQIICLHVLRHVEREERPHTVAQAVALFIIIQDRHTQARARLLAEAEAGSANWIYGRLRRPRRSSHLLDDTTCPNARPIRARR